MPQVHKAVSESRGAHGRGRPVVSKPHVSTWHRGEACGLLTTADIQQYFPKAWERLAVTITRFVKTNAAQSWLTGCEQLGWGLQRPTAPSWKRLLSRRPPEAGRLPCRCPSAEVLGPCFVWSGTRRQEGALLTTNRPFPCEQISAQYFQRVCLWRPGISDL